jgi:putative phosphoribosyl transferase
MRFADRSDAGRQLAARVADLALDDPVVLGLPRGGVPVAFEVAAGLGAPLEVFVARKIGAPGHVEYGIGAIAESPPDVDASLAADAGVVRNLQAASVLRLPDAAWDELVAAEMEELQRRVVRYRGDRSLPSLRGREVVIVDDGLATGVTAEAALSSVRRSRPRRLVLAVPVCAPDTADRLASSGAADEVVCVERPARFYAVGEWYSVFSQTTDDEVVELLNRARR